LRDYIIVGFVLVVILALANWRMSAKRAKIASRLLPMIFNLYFLFHIIMSPVLDLWRPIVLSESNIFLFIFVSLMLLNLSFMATTYIQYAKNKTDIETVKNTIRDQLFFNIGQVALLAIVIYITIQMQAW